MNADKESEQLVLKQKGLSLPLPDYNNQLQGMTTIAPNSERFWGRLTSCTNAILADLALKLKTLFEWL